MLHGKKIACVIPARMEARRLPGKPLRLLGERPLVQCTYEAALGCDFFDAIVLATDSEEIASVGRGFGADVRMTSPLCESGTERLSELYLKGEVTADIWVNWQGDAPFLSRAMLEELLQGISGGGEIWTLKKKIGGLQEFQSKNVVKVVSDEQNRALYFSRSPVPYGGEGLAYRHVGLYAFTAAALKKISALPPHPLEEAESLEQLRWLMNGMKIALHETEGEAFSIDTPADLAAAQQKIESGTGTVTATGTSPSTSGRGVTLPEVEGGVPVAVTVPVPEIFLF